MDSKTITFLLTQNNQSNHDTEISLKTSSSSSYFGFFWILLIIIYEFGLAFTYVQKLKELLIFNVEYVLLYKA